MNVLRKMIMLLLVLGFATHAQAGEVEDSFARGKTAYTQGDYQQALREYRRTLNWPGEHTARAHYNLGVCHFQLAQLPEAVTAYQAALKFAPNYFAAAYGLGLAYSQQGKLPEALLAFGSAVDWSQGRDPDALLEYGTLLAQAGDFKEAENNLRQALKFAGSHKPATHNNLGVILAREGFFNAAEQEFLAANKLTAKSLPVVANNLKLCRQRLNTRPSAIAGWELTPGPWSFNVE